MQQGLSPAQQPGQRIGGSSAQAQAPTSGDPFGSMQQTNPVDFRQQDMRAIPEFDPQKWATQGRSNNPDYAYLDTVSDSYNHLYRTLGMNPSAPRSPQSLYQAKHLGGRINSMDVRDLMNIDIMGEYQGGFGRAASVLPNAPQSVVPYATSMGWAEHKPQQDSNYLRDAYKQLIEQMNRNYLL